MKCNVVHSLHMVLMFTQCSWRDGWFAARNLESGSMNPRRNEFILRNIYIHSHILSLINIEMAHEILPCGSTNGVDLGHPEYSDFSTKRS